MGGRGIFRIAALVAVPLLSLYATTLDAMASSGNRVAARASSAASDPSGNVCAPNGIITGSSAGPTLTCQIPAQGSTTSTSNNNAVCILHSSAPVILEECDITQANGSGANNAFVLLDIQQHGTPTQDAVQRANVTQKNTSGQNRAAIAESIQQDSRTVDTGSNQNQCADQGFQDQNGCPPDSANFAPVGVKVNQTNDSGANLLGLLQSGSQNGETSSPGANQVQNDGQVASINQFDPTQKGPARAFVQQNVNQDQQGPNKLAQTQVADPDPARCCNFFQGSTVQVQIHQHVVQEQGTEQPEQNGEEPEESSSTPSDAQFAKNTIDCHAFAVPGPGICSGTEFIDQNGQTITTSCPGTSDCVIGQACATGTACTPCTPPSGESGGTCPPPCIVVGCGAAPRQAARLPASLRSDRVIGRVRAGPYPGGGLRPAAATRFV